MWKLTILLLSLSAFARAEEENPFLDLASSLLQNMGDGGSNNGLGAIGNIVGSLMQDGGSENGAADVLSGKFIYIPSRLCIPKEDRQSERNATFTSRNHL